MTDEAPLINGGPDYDALSFDPLAYDVAAVDNWARNSTVAIVPLRADDSHDFEGACSGVLVAPRVVLTAAHCVRPSDHFEILFGPEGFPRLADFASAGRSTTGSPLNFGSSSTTGFTGLALAQSDLAHACEAFDGNGLGASCNDGGVVAVEPYTADLSRFDLAMLFLDRRVDWHPNDRGGYVLANPARISRAVATGTVTHAGFGLVDTCPVRGTSPAVPWVRQRIDQAVGCPLTGDPTACFDVVALASLLAITPYGGLPGDSGGPFYTGRRAPTPVGTNPLEVGAIFSGFVSPTRSDICDSNAFNVAVSLADPSVVDWLEQRLGPSFAGTTITRDFGPFGTRAIWTGPDDIPRRTDPDTISWPAAITPCPYAPEHPELCRTWATRFDADPDGDGLIGPHDNCWGIANYDQQFTDPLLMATCTVRRWGPPPAPNVCGTELPEEVRHYPCVAFDPAAVETGNDRDFDGVPDLCDNCPTTWNPAPQADRNCDGTGDACAVDSDGDGIEDLFDSCPFVANAISGIDCNSDAESVRRATERPDLCDPVPCALVSPSTTARVPSSATPSVITSAQLRGPTLIASDPLARPNPDLTATGTVGFRFCRCDVAVANDEGTRTNCDARAGCELRRGPVGLETDLYTEVTSAWRPMTLPASSTPELSVTFRGVGAALDAVSVGSAIDITWPFTTDPAAQPLTTAFGAPAAQGVIWSAVRTVTPTCSTPACLQLASHYWSGILRGGTVQGPNPRLVDGTALVPWPAPQPICLTCDGSFPAPFLGTTCTANTFCDPSTWVLRSDRVEQPAQPQMSGALGKWLLDPIATWTVASEPREALGATAIRLAGRSLGQVIARVTVAGSALGLVEEIAPQLAKPPAATLAAAAQTYATTGDPNSAGRGAVLLGTQARLFAFGGARAERQYVEVVDLATGSSALMPLRGEVPGRVLAATHRLTSPSLLVLDRVPRVGERESDDFDRDAREHVRLLVVDLRAGASRELARFPWLGRFDRYALVTLVDGDTVLVASSSTAERHLLVRFRVTTDARGRSSLELRARAAGEGAMVAPPLVSLEGVSLAVQRRRRAWTTVGYGLAASRRPEHALDDCF